MTFSSFVFEAALRPYDIIKTGFKSMKSFFCLLLNHLHLLVEAKNKSSFSNLHSSFVLLLLSNQPMHNFSLVLKESLHIVEY
jgi:hypothetical protein